MNIIVCFFFFFGGGRGGIKKGLPEFSHALTKKIYAYVDNIY